MGIHDIRTMNLVSEALHQIDPSIFILWWMDRRRQPLLLKKSAQRHTAQLKCRVTAFSDDIRDAIRPCLYRDDSRLYGRQTGLRKAYPVRA